MWEEVNLFKIKSANRMNSIFPLKRQEEITDGWVKERLDSVLKESMKKADLPMWIIVSEENNDDPVVNSLTPSLYDCTRRLAIFAYTFDKEKDEVERYFIGGAHPGLVELYNVIWDRENETQWERLRKFVEEKQPTRIGINQSNHFPEADGLSHSSYLQLCETLGSEWSKKLVSAEHLVIHWLQKRTDKELGYYRFLADLTQNLAEVILSNEVIYPGITTTNEVVEWIRQKAIDLGVKTSFYPTIDVQRKGAEVDRLSGTTIMPGDIVHLDFGLTYLGLSTDIQRLGYVLKRDETKPPQGLQDALDQAVLMGEIVLNKMVPGAIGNDVFESSIKESKEKSIKAMVYNHAIGINTHEVGPLSGMFDQQKSIPIRGDLELITNSAHALEYNVKAYIPEWEQETFMFMEENVAVYEDGADYLTSRHEEFYLIR